MDKLIVITLSISTFGLIGFVIGLFYSIKNKLTYNSTGEIFSTAFYGLLIGCLMGCLIITVIYTMDIVYLFLKNE